MKTKWSNELTHDYFYYHVDNAKLIVGCVSGNVAVGDSVVIVQTFMISPDEIYFGLLQKIENNIFTIMFDDLTEGTVMFEFANTQNILYSLTEYQLKTGEK